MEAAEDRNLLLDAIRSCHSLDTFVTNISLLENDRGLLELADALPTTLLRLGLTGWAYGLRKVGGNPNTNQTNRQILHGNMCILNPDHVHYLLKKLPRLEQYVSFYNGDQTRVCFANLSTSLSSINIRNSRLSGRQLRDLVDNCPMLKKVSMRIEVDTTVENHNVSQGDADYFCEKAKR